MTPTQTKAEKHALFLNLITLGFELQHQEAKHGCQFDENMFDKPNKRAFEVVSQFLFNKINQKQAQELFRSCFPTTDKRSTQEFRKVCYNWLKRISEDSKRFHFPKVNATLLMSPGGHEFIHLMFHFSNFALFHLGEKMAKSEILQPTVLAKEKSALKLKIKSIDAMTYHEFQQLCLQMKLIKKAEEEKQLVVSQQIENHHSMHLKTKPLRQRLHHPYHGQLISTDKQRLEIRKKRKNELEHKLSVTRGLWKKLFHYVDETKHHRDVLHSAIGVEKNKLFLDSNHLQPKVPAKLLDKCQDEIYQTIGTSLYQEGKINLSSLVSLCNLSLMIITEKIHEYGIPNFEKYIACIDNQVKIHKDELLRIFDIRNHLERLQPLIDKSDESVTCQLENIYGKRKSFNIDSSRDVPGDSLDLSIESQHETPLVVEYDYSQSLAEMYLTPTDASITSLFEDIMDEKSSSDEDLKSDVLSNNSIASQSWSVPLEELKIHKKQKPFTTLQSSTRKTALPKPVWVQDPGNRFVLERRLPVKTAQTASKTPDHARKLAKGANKGRKSMSLPSSPMASLGLLNIPDDLSRSYYAESKLIDQIVNCTVQEICPDSPQVVYHQDTVAQLDETAFVSTDKIPRTPPTISRSLDEEMHAGHQILQNASRSNYLMQSAISSPPKYTSYSHTLVGVSSASPLPTPDVEMPQDRKINSGKSSPLSSIDSITFSAPSSSNEDSDIEDDQAENCSPSLSQEFVLSPFSSQLQTPRLAQRNVSEGNDEQRVNGFFTPGKPAFQLLDFSDEENSPPAAQGSPLISFDDGIDLTQSNLSQNTMRATNPIDLLMATPPPLLTPQLDSNSNQSPSLVPPPAKSLLDITNPETPVSSLTSLHEFSQNLLSHAANIQAIDLETPELQRFKSVLKYKSDD